MMIHISEKIDQKLAGKMLEFYRFLVLTPFRKWYVTIRKDGDWIGD